MDESFGFETMRLSEPAQTAIDQKSQKNHVHKL